MASKKLQPHSVFPFFHHDCDLLLFNATVELPGGRWEQSKCNKAHSSVEDSPVFLEWTLLRLLQAFNNFQSSEKVDSDNVSSFLITFMKEGTFGRPYSIIFNDVTSVLLSSSINAGLTFNLHYAGFPLFFSFLKENTNCQGWERCQCRFGNYLEDEDHWRLSHFFIHFVPSRIVIVFLTMLLFTLK